jgi:hypothetical protein
MSKSISVSEAEVSVLLSCAVLPFGTLQTIIDLGSSSVSVLRDTVKDIVPYVAYDVLQDRNVLSDTSQKTKDLYVSMFNLHMNIEHTNPVEVFSTYLDDPEITRKKLYAYGFKFRD